MPFKGQQFDDAQTIETTAMNALKATQKSKQQGCAQKWKGCWVLVVESQ